MKQRPATRPLALLVTCAVLGSVAWAKLAQNQTADQATRVLVFSGTGWFRHPEIPRTNGWLAGVLMRGGGFGLIGDLIVGLVGAFIGDWLLPRLGIHLGVGIVALIMNALIGAIILLLLLRLIGGGGWGRRWSYGGRWGRRW